MHRVVALGISLALSSAASAATVVNIGAPDGGATLHVQFNGINISSNAGSVNTSTNEPYAFPDDGARMAISAWRIPGGLYSLKWHWLDGDDGCAFQTYGPGASCPAWDGGIEACSSPGPTQVGPSMDDYILAIDGAGGKPLVTLNWEAVDQESLNLVEYVNGFAPANPDPSWTTTSFAEDASAPTGYFAWLRKQRLSGHGPVGVRYFELGNEIYGNWVCDRVTGNDATRYANRAASLIAQIHALDANAKVCVVGGPSPWNSAMLQALAATGVTPDCFVHHDYPQSVPTVAQQTAAMARTLMDEASDPATVATTYRSQIDTAYGNGTSSHVELIMTEHGESTDADVWESCNTWGAIYEARFNAEAVLAGWANLDPWLYVGSGGFGFVAVDASGARTYASTYFGAWMFGLLAQDGGEMLGTSGAPQNVFTYAMRGNDGSTRVMLVNESLTNSQDISLHFDDVQAASVVDYHYDATLGGASLDGGSSPRRSLDAGPTSTALELDGGTIALSLTPLDLEVLVIGQGISAGSTGSSSAASTSASSGSSAASSSSSGASSTSASTGTIAGATDSSTGTSGSSSGTGTSGSSTTGASTFSSSAAGSTGGAATTSGCGCGAQGSGDVSLWLTLLAFLTITLRRPSALRTKLRVRAPSDHRHC